MRNLVSGFANLSPSFSSCTQDLFHEGFRRNADYPVSIPWFTLLFVHQIYQRIPPSAKRLILLVIVLLATCRSAKKMTAK